MKKSYSEKLKDPRWQKRRLEIMKKANFSCENCGSTEQTLNVHHLIYRKKTEPWDYEDNVLKCICEHCHKTWHKDREHFLESMALIEAQGVGIEEFEWLAIAFTTGNASAFYAVIHSCIWKLEEVTDIKNIADCCSRRISHIEKFSKVAQLECQSE